MKSHKLYVKIHWMTNLKFSITISSAFPLEKTWHIKENSVQVKMLMAVQDLAMMFVFLF